MWAVVLLAPACAWLHVRGLRAAAPDALRVFAGEGFVLDVPVRNGGRLFALRDVLLFAAEPEGPGARPLGRVGGLAPGEEERAPLAWRLPRRGRHRALAFSAATRFPLGLVWCRAAFELPADLLALPRLGSLGDLGRLPAATLSGERLPRPRRAGDDEPYAVREWREGESQRNVHWKLSARRGRRILREHRRREEPAVHLVLATARTGARAGEDRAFERAVGLAATLGEHWLRRGRVVRLALVGGRAGEEAAVVELPPLRGRAGLLRMLEALAEVAPSEGDPLACVRAGLARVRAGEAAFGVLAGDGRTPIPRPGRARREVVLDACAPDLELVYLPGRAWGARPRLAATDARVPAEVA